MRSIALSMFVKSEEMFSCVSSAKDCWFTGCLAIRSERSLVYRVNKTGPRTGLWGTPNDGGTGSESCTSTETNCILPVMHDLNHTSAVPSTPKYDCSRAKRISWSVVSKAAARSSSITREIFPSSISASRSLVTWVRAVSVLCPDRYADWNGLFDFKWSWSWQRTVFSNSLDKNYYYS